MTLTDRYREEILRLSAGGMSPRAIGQRFGISRSGIRHALARWRAEGVEVVTGEPEPAAPSPERDRLRQRVRELERDTAATRELAEAIRDAARMVSVPNPAPRVVNRTSAAPRWDTPVDIVLHVSDIQYGERVDGDHVPGGRYSPEVFRDERLPRWIDAATQVVEAVAMQHPIETLWIAQGGDFVEGDRVFNGQTWHLAMDAGTQVATLAPLWAQAIAQVAAVAKAVSDPVVAVVSVVGNHGVPTGRKAGAVPPSLNYDYLTYELVRHILAGMPGGGNVDFYDEHARHAVYFNVAGHLWLMTHGDQDRGGGIIGIPGPNGVANDLAVRVQTGLNHKVHICGHFHRPSMLTVGGASQKFWSGDWCGANNLSTGRGGGSEPTQFAYVVHPRYGVSQMWPLRLAPETSQNPPEVIDLYDPA